MQIEGLFPDGVRAGAEYPSLLRFIPHHQDV